MGWKNVKEHYRIEHIVHVRDGKIWIGSPYISEIISIDKDGNVSWACAMSRRRGDALDRYIIKMESDRSQLVQLIEKPDTFGQLKTVYTYHEGDILEKQCEEIGWPNNCTDGELQYENSHFATRAEALEKARRNSAAWIDSLIDRFGDRQQQLAEIHADLRKWFDINKRLFEDAT